ncbi:MAG: hypothetical protein ACK5L3_14400, partial [Oscillospiraceae bacterium]
TKFGRWWGWRFWLDNQEEIIMPLWDLNTGNVWSELGAIQHDFNSGGVGSLLQTIWDVNSAWVSSVVWTAETDIYPGMGGSATLPDYGDQGADGDFYAILSTDGGNKSTKIQYKAVDLTPYKTLRIRCYLMANGYRLMSSGVVIHNSMTYPGSMVGYGTTYTRRHKVVTSNFSGVETVAFNDWWEVDVSALSGVYYVMVMCYSEAGLQHNGEARIYNIIGTY